MVEQFTVKTKRFLNNPLLQRKQFVVDIAHPNSATPSRTEVAEKLAAAYKVADAKLISLYGFKSAFGGNSTTGFGLIYDNEAALLKYEPNYRLVRTGAASKKANGGGRRVKKDTKNKAKKVRCAEKAKLLKRK